MSLRIRSRRSNTLRRTSSVERAIRMSGMSGPFYTPIPQNPVLDPDSSTKSATLAQIPGKTGNHHFAGLSWTTTFFAIDGDPTYSIAYPPDPDYTWATDAHRVEELNPMRITEPNFYPQPGGMIDGAGWDGWATVIDPVRNQGYGFWRMRKESGVWRATTSHAFAYPGDFSVIAGLGRGDGLPANAGSITVQEAVEAVNDTTGNYVFPHALALSVPSSWVDSLFRYPATKTDGSVTPTTETISEGMRFQMDPAAAAPTTSNKITQAVFRTLKVYGAYIVDRTGVDGPIMMNFERMDPANPSDMVNPADGSPADPTNKDAIAGVYYRAGYEWDYYPLDGTGRIPWGSMRLLAKWDGSV